MADLPIEKVRKWCPGKEHVGDREFVGWMWSDKAPTRALARVPLDEHGRYVQPCDACVDRWEARARARARINREKDEPDELTRPKRTDEDEDGPPF